MKVSWFKRISWHQFRIPMLLALAVPILLLMEINIDRLAQSVDQDSVRARGVNSEAH